MSGAATNFPVSQPSDEVSIVVGGQTISGWEDVTINRGIERVPASFEIRLTEKYPEKAGLVDIKPTMPIQVRIGADKILTGYVDHYAAGISSGQHEVHIAGRSMSEDLVDCSGKFQAYQINNTTIVGLATTLCQPFGMAVLSPDGDSRVIPQFNVILTETPYEIIERVARWANFLVYDDVSGGLIIAKLSDKTMASGFAEGQNVQMASVSFDAGDRYTEIEPILLATSVLTMLPDGNGNPAVPYVPNVNWARDRTFSPRADGEPRYRPLLLMCEQNDVDPILAQQRVNWEMSRRWGRSQSVTITCDSWRDSAGTLWTPNAAASIDLPSLKLPNRTWLISDVAYLRNEEGTTARVTLMPKEAFIPSPDVLLPYDWQVAEALGDGGAGGLRPNAR